MITLQTCQGDENQRSTINSFVEIEEVHVEAGAGAASRGLSTYDTSVGGGSVSATSARVA